MINENALTDLIHKVLKNLGVIQKDVKEIKSDVVLIRSDIGNLNDEIIDLKKKVDNHSYRIDLIGKQLSNLDDDAPSGEDFSNLEKRVTKLEQKVVFA